MVKDSKTKTVQQMAEEGIMAAREAIRNAFALLGKTPEGRVMARRFLDEGKVGQCRMGCYPKCKKTATLDGGRREMVSEPGNPKFKIPFTPHPQCKECMEQERKEIEYCIKMGLSRKI